MEHEKIEEHKDKGEERGRLLKQERTKLERETPSLGGKEGIERGEREDDKQNVSRKKIRKIKIILVYPLHLFIHPSRIMISVFSFTRNICSFSLFFVPKNFNFFIPSFSAEIISSVMKLMGQVMMS